jgi:hypothetical protein
MATTVKIGTDCPPCCKPAACCSDTLPDTLLATLVGTTGDCTCPQATVLLSKVASYSYLGGAADCCGINTDWNLRCFGNNTWVATRSCLGQAFAFGVACAPFDFTLTFFPSGIGTQPCAGTITYRITPF